MSATVTIRRLGPSDAPVLANIADDLFDDAIDLALTRAFLNDPRHHLFVALDADRVIGVVSGVHYVHPDKRAQLFINDIATAAAYRRRGIARALLAALRDHARALGCSEAWVLTERSNLAARSLYEDCAGDAGEATLMFTFKLDSA